MSDAPPKKRSLYETLTTPPPPKPAPKLPPFGPQHLVGAGILAVGLWGITKLFIRSAQKQSAQRLREAREGAPPPASPQDQAMAHVGPSRGQYGYGYRP
jgi:hypothetical protein